MNKIVLGPVIQQEIKDEFSEENDADSEIE
jgi:hypothetical protein